MKAHLLDSFEIAPEVRHFVFEAPDVERLEFTPGQFVSIQRDLKGRSVTRAYSIASAPRGNQFELCLNIVREGRMSPWLFELRAGEALEFSGPLGFFVPRTPPRDSVMVATGTGIAPFRGMLGWGPVVESDARITLVFGVRYEDGILYREEFEALESRRPGFRFLPTVTRPGQGWSGRTGRVQAHLGEATGGRREIDFYVCGLKAMVDEVRGLLKAQGFDRRQIIVEKYD